MKKIVLISFCILNFASYAQKWEWAIRENPQKIAVDSAGNFFTYKDSILKRFNSQGILTWQKHLSGDVLVSEIAADNSGNMYLVASFVNFAIDTNHFYSLGKRDAFFGKISSSGNLLWHKINGSLKDDYLNDIFIDSHQNIFVCGGTYADSASLPQMYAAKYSVNGTLESLNTFTNGDVWEIASDNTGNIYLLGGIAFEDSIDFGNGISVGPGEYYGSHFVAKINSVGTTLWAKNLGGDYYAPHQNLGVDKGGNFYLTLWGRYSGFTLTKWDNAGSFVWSKWMDGVYGGCNSLCVDNRDIIWLAGNLWNSNGFYHQPYVWKYDQSGTLEEAIIETGTMEGMLISNDYHNNIYISGNLSDSAVFGNTTLNISGGNHFLAKFSSSLVSASFKITSSLCEKNSIVFQNTSINDTAAHWEFSGGIPATSTKFSDTVIFNTSGIHAVKLISYNGTSSDTIVKNIFINPQPAIPIITQVSNTLISNYSSGNKWYYEKDSIRSASQSTYQITLEGNYKVCYTNVNGCYNISAPFKATFNGISESIPPVTTAWIKTISGAESDRGIDIIQTFDKGFLVCAVTNSFPVTQYNTLLIKYDSSANREWSKTIGPRTVAVQIKQSSDSGFVLLSNANGIGIVKLNKLGDVVFTHTYKYLDWSLYGHSFSFTNDGGYMISGFYHNKDGPMGFYNAYLLKLDRNGLTQWSKIISVDGYADGGSIYQTADGGYIFNGNGSFPCCNSQNYICKLDQYGAIQWIKEYQNLGYILESAKMIIANNDGYIMAGSTIFETSGGNDAYVMKVSLTGAVEWCKVYGTVYEEKALAIKATGNGYIVLGRTEGFKTNKDLYLFKIDNDGNQLWSRAYGDLNDDEGASITETNDHGFAITGSYKGEDYSSSKGDIYFLKTDSLGNTGCRSIIVWTQVKDIVPIVQNSSPTIYAGVFPDTLSFSSIVQNIPDSTICDVNVIPTAVNEHHETIAGISIFPNPTNGTFTIESKLAIGEIKIYNALGETVYNKNFKSSKSDYKDNLDLSKEIKGIYFIEITSSGQRAVKKIVLQ